MPPVEGLNCQVKKLGLNLNFKQVIKLGMYGISPEYIKEMADAGIVDLDDTSEADDDELEVVLD